MNDIIQLKFTLQWTKPPIWRRVLVNKQTTFFELHHIIQITMGWENYHLYEFEVHDYRIGEPNEEFEDMGFGRDKLIDDKTIKLDSIITDIKEKFEYKYDFGDGWNHQIVVEKFLPIDNKTRYPICIDGKLNCPPEDCGGVGGYYGMLEIIENKRHPEHKEMLEWLGGQYDPEYFDIDGINDELKMLDGYIEEYKSDN